MSYTVLIIDDDESVHDVLGGYLKLSGLEVSHAYDGSLGLQALEENKPDVVLMDVQMPVIDGFEAMKVISGNSELSSIPVLFLTSLSGVNLKVKGLELGAEDYILKPFNKAEVLARVRTALRRGGRFRRNEKAAEGNLEDLKLADILQTLEIGNKTAVVDLKDAGGVLYIEGGMLVHARRGEFEGSEAFYRVLLHEKGRFTINFDRIPPDITKDPSPIQRTLMAGMTYIDELREILSRTAAGNPLVEIVSAADPEIDRFKDASPLRLYDLVSLMRGDMKESADKISKAAGSGSLKFIEEGAPARE